MSRTPTALTTVVATSRRTPSTTALCAPVADSGEGSAPGPPTSWKPDQIEGSTACRAMAAVATVRTWPTTMTQPVNQPTSVPASRLDHWNTAPEIG